MTSERSDMKENAALTDLLSENLIYEIAKALALPPTERIRRIIASLTGKAMRRFTQLAAELDCVVGKEGLSGGACWLLPRFVRGHSAQGIENIPPAGPLVIASNHPASIDSVVISAYVPRRDYKVIIGEIPFFKNLPSINKNAIFAPADTMGRMQAVREVIRHLKNDGAILIFPRGEIEPDPAWMPQPDVEFDHWSRSLEIFLKHVPHTQVLVTMVSGVISKAAMHHPITWIRRARPDRQRLAFMYQMIRQMLAGREVFGLTPRVTFGDLISAANTTDREHMLQTITRSAHHALKTHVAPTLSHVASDSLRHV
jgi:Acyltransferase